MRWTIVRIHLALLSFVVASCDDASMAPGDHDAASRDGQADVALVADGSVLPDALEHGDSAPHDSSISPDSTVPADAIFSDYPDNQCFPTCVEALTIPCPQPTDERALCRNTPEEFLVCYSTGVRRRSFIEVRDGVQYTINQRTLPDSRTLCFSSERNLQTGAVTLRDGTGKLVALHYFSEQHGHNIVVCYEEGKQYRADPDRPACLNRPMGMPCVEGMCEWLGPR